MRSSFIARAQLFGNPTRALGRISPGGRWLSWLAPERGVLNIWVAPVGHMRDARVITTDRQRGVCFHAWANSSALSFTSRTRVAPRTGTSTRSRLGAARRGI